MFCARTEREMDRLRARERALLALLESVKDVLGKPKQCGSSDRERRSLTYSSIKIADLQARIRAALREGQRHG